MVQATITRSPESAPFLSVPWSCLLEPVGSTVLRSARAASGSAPLLSSASSRGFMDRAEDQGRFGRIQRCSELCGGTIEIPAGATVTVSLQLDFVSNQTSGSGPGGDARAAVAQLPADRDPGVFARRRVGLGGFRCDINGIWKYTRPALGGAAPQYQAGMQHIVFPFTPSIASFAPAAPSPIFLRYPARHRSRWLAGDCRSRSRLLARSVRHPAPGTLDVQVNPGIIGPVARGEVAPSEPGWICVMAGEILLLAPAPANSRLTEEFLLWQENAPSTRRSSVDVIYLKAFCTHLHHRLDFRDC